MFVRIDRLAPRHTPEVWSIVGGILRKLYNNTAGSPEFYNKNSPKTLARLSSLQGAVMYVFMLQQLHIGSGNPLAPEITI
jgi:hypothetical protein